MKTNQKTILKILIIVYSIVMLWLLFGQRLDYVHFDSYFEQIRRKINLIPFYTIYNYISLLEQAPNVLFIRHYIINLAGNIVMFIPLGVLLPAIWKKLRGFWRFTLTTALIIISIETLQLFTLLGSMDIDDFILNLIGALIGYIFFFILYKLFAKSKNKTVYRLK